MIPNAHHRAACIAGAMVQLQGLVEAKQAGHAILVGPAGDISAFMAHAIQVQIMVLRDDAFWAEPDFYERLGLNEELEPLRCWVDELRLLLGPEADADSSPPLRH